MVTIDNLTYSYDGEKNVLDGASFELHSGKIYCLLGVNGAGKTTLFNCLTGFLESNLTLDEEIVNNRILYIQDNMTFYKNLTGIEFIEIIFKLKKKEIRKSELNFLVEKLKLQEKIKDLISTYSLGMKQKLLLIIGFLLDYEFVFMDEPFGAIDFISAEIVNGFLKELKQKGKTIVVSTHLIDIASEIADDILFLNNGKVYSVKNNFNSSLEIKTWIREKI